MLRSFLFAIGIFLLILGAQTLVVDKWILSRASALTPVAATANDSYGNRTSPYRTAGYSRNGYSRNLNNSTYGNASYYNQPNQQAGTFKKVYQTRDWMPWSLLAAGTIIVLYTYSTGRRHIE